MYDLRIEHSGINTYLVHPLKKQDSVDTVSLGMITNNVIQGVVPVQCIQENGEKYLKYDISHKETAENIFMDKGYYSKTPKRLLDVFLEISSTFLRAEDYMIDLSLFALELDYIYVDVLTDEISLMCIPITSYGRSPLDLAAFFMGMTTYKQLARTENDLCIQTLSDYLKDAAAFSLEVFHPMLDSLKQNFSRQEFWKNEFADHPSKPFPSAFAKADIQKISEISTIQPPIAREADGLLHSTEAPQLSNEADRIDGSHVSAEFPAQPPEPHPEPQIHDKADKRGEFHTSPMGGGSMMWTRVPQNQSEPGFPVVPMVQSWGQRGFPDAPGTQSWNQPELPDVPMPQNQSEPEPEPAAVPRIQSWGQPELPGVPMPQSQSEPESEPAAVSRTQSWNQPELPGVPMFQSQSGPEPAAVPRGQSWNQPELSVAPMSPSQRQGQPAPPTFPMPQIQGQREPPAVPPQSQPGLSAPGVPGLPQPQDEVISPTEESPDFPFILRRKTMEKFFVNKSVFKIGKAKNDVDYYIGDNKAISRDHANIITCDGQYYIVDMGSTNHTYVDGCKVQSHVMKEIVHGAVLKFADEEFDFMRYA